MRAAQDDVENGDSLRTAAARYDVSLTSLSQRLNGNLKRPPREMPGPFQRGGSRVG